MLRVLGATVCVLTVSLMVGTVAAQEKTKVCFIYVGPHNDQGWSQQHDTARLEAEVAFADQVETKYLEKIPEGQDAERSIEALVRDGCKLVFTTSFGFMEATATVAARYPDVKFEHATGYMTGPNLATYNARFYEGRYVIGQIAARVSKSGIAGYIGSVPVPEVIMGINAFLLGAQSINPDFKLKVVWIGEWYNPGKEREAATTLVDQGVDILTQHTDSPEPLKVAQERGIFGFGQASDMVAHAPAAQLTAIVDEWGPYYTERTKALLDGTWEPHAIWYGLKEGMVVMAPFTNLPDDVIAMAEDTIAKIKSGALHPFTGPVKNQAGEEFLAAGQVIDDAALAVMFFYVEGVDGTIPQ